MSASEDESVLFQPLALGGGAISLKHRVVMAPMSRNRANEPDMAPQEMNVEYYRQRASDGGLIISEATNISMESCGFHHAPGIWSDAQVAGWRKVTDAVHSKGGIIFCQLWHVGRISHPSWTAHPLLAANSDKPMPMVSASDVPAPGTTYNGYPQGGPVDNVAPRPLETEEIPRLIEDYRHAARCALRAGFDGVEVQCAHGFLLDQFMRTGTNLRSDAYGGTAENRARLFLEVVAAVVQVVGPGRVGARLSPTLPGSFVYFGTHDDDIMDADGVHEAYGHAARGLNAFPLAYLLLTEARASRRADAGDHDGLEKDAAPAYSTGPAAGANMEVSNSSIFRSVYKGVLIAATGYTPGTAEQAVRDGTLDMVAFARYFVSNPDLPTRIRQRAVLNKYDRSTFYSYGEEGYTDYPDLEGTMGVQGKYETIDLNETVEPGPGPF